MHAVFVVAFFSFLRASNLLPYRFSDSSSRDCLFLRQRNVIFSSQGCFLRVCKMKTVQFGEDLIDIPPHVIHNSILCPVSALKRYFSLVPTSPDSPWFILQENSIILIRHINSFLNNALLLSA